MLFSRPVIYIVLLMVNLLNNNLLILKKVFSPWRIYLIIIGLFVLFSIVGIPLLSMDHSGGEQMPLILLGYALNVLACSMLISSLIIPFIYRSWFKKYFLIPIGRLILILRCYEK